MSDSIPKVYEAISSVTAAISKVGIQKSRSNSQQGYKFRGIDDVYNALAPIIAEHQLCILPRVIRREVTERQTKSGTALFYVTCDVEYDLISAVDGSKHTVVVVGEAMDSADKATAKAMSAAYKSMCLQAFCIPVEGTPDADMVTHDVAPDGPDLSRAIDVIMSCETMDDLQREFAVIWKAFPASARKQLVAAKDQRKGELSA